LDGVQYELISIDERGLSSFDKIYIDGYSDGDQVGSVDIKILRRIVDSIVGYINFRGMKLTTTMNYESSLGVQNGQNPVSDLLENSTFKENYLILIGTNYYQMADIDGNDIILSGPNQNWGLVGQSNISYSIIQFVKHTVTIQSGFDREFRTFDPLVDRRGDGSDFVIEQDIMPFNLVYKMQLLNKLNSGETIEESVQAKEKIWYTVVLKEE